MTGIMGVFIIQNRSCDRQAQMTGAVQTARAAMDMMAREIRMAGYDPTCAGFDGVLYSPTQLQIRSDFSGDAASDPPDGNTDDPHESIAYRYDPAHFQIDRDTGGGYQPFAEDIDAFSFDYLDEDGHPTTVNAHIRQVRLTVVARTEKRDPAYGANHGYRTYRLCSLVAPPNLTRP
jgi:type IV pilus assembly protein PilW